MADKSVFSPSSKDGGFNEQLELISSVLGKACTSTLVEVVGVIKPEDNNMIGSVDVLPLVNQVDGYGNAVPHNVIFGIVYTRPQGGLNAVIIDPEIGDIGLCVFAHNDISVVKATKKQANPGSYRRNDWADGIYTGAIPFKPPTQYIKMEPGGAGITLISPTKVTIQTPEIDLVGKTVHTGQVWMNGKRVDETHEHSDPQGGNTGSVI